VKFFKNTTINDIFIKAAGTTIPTSEQYEIDPINYILWATDDAITEMTPYINSGDIIVNNGTDDLLAEEGIRFLKYPDRIEIQENDVSKIRVIKKLNFEGDVTVTDEGSGKVTIDVTGGVGTEFCDIVLTEELGLVFNNNLEWVKHNGNCS